MKLVDRINTVRRIDGALRLAVGVVCIFFAYYFLYFLSNFIGIVSSQQSLPPIYIGAMAMWLALLFALSYAITGNVLALAVILLFAAASATHFLLRADSAHWIFIPELVLRSATCTALVYLLIKNSRLKTASEVVLPHRASPHR